MAVWRRRPGSDDDQGLESIEAAGRRLHFLRRGAGQPVVLVHGLGGSPHWWRHNIDALAERHTVYALDLGRRDRWLHGRLRVRPQEAAEVLGAWLDAVGLERPHLIGHSLGGQMAIRLAAGHPERVDRLVLVNSAGLPFDIGLWRLGLRAVGAVPERTPEFSRIVLRSSLRTNPLVVLQTAREMMREDVSTLLGRITAPTLIVWGARDRMVPLGNAFRLKAGIPDARLLIVPTSGHNPMYYAAGLFNRTVLDFFAGKEASGDGEAAAD